MTLLGGTENKIQKDENGENVPHLEIPSIVLVHFNIVNNEYEHDLEYCIHLFLINHLVHY